jgi:hypothetical protein
LKLPPTGDGTDADTTMLPPDDVLVAGLRFVDEATFARLVDSWSPAMIHLARAHVSTSGSAAEVVQDTWLAVIRGVQGFIVNCPRGTGHTAGVSPRARTSRFGRAHPDFWPYRLCSLEAR